MNDITALEMLSIQAKVDKANEEDEVALSREQSQAAAVVLRAGAAKLNALARMVQMHQAIPVRHAYLLDQAIIIDQFRELQKKQHFS